MNRSKNKQAERRSVTRGITAGRLVCVSDGFDIATIQFPVPQNVITDTKIMFLGQLGGKLWSESCFYNVYYESYGETRKFGNLVIRYLATLLSDGFEIAQFDFPCLKTYMKTQISGFQVK